MSVMRRARAPQNWCVIRTAFCGITGGRRHTTSVGDPVTYALKGLQCSRAKRASGTQACRHPCVGPCRAQGECNARGARRHWQRQGAGAAQLRYPFLERESVIARRNCAGSTHAARQAAAAAASATSHARLWLVVVTASRPVSVAAPSGSAVHGAAGRDRCLPHPP